MKKTAVIILCIAMLIGICTAGATAAETENLIEWELEEHTGYYVHRFKGSLEEGKTTIYPIPSGDGLFDDASYTFEVSKSGCYLIDCSEAEDFKIAEIFEGNYACGTEEYAIADDGNRIYYLEKGTALISIAAKQEGSKISIDYYGGEQPAETVDADYYIESIEIECIEDYLTCYEYYDGTYSFDDLRGGKITANFKDGSQTAIKYNYDAGDWGPSITLPNNVVYPVLIYQIVDEETANVYLAIEIDERRYIKEEYTIIKDDLTVNRAYLKFNVHQYSRYIKNTLSYAFSLFETDESPAVLIREFGSAVSDCIIYVRIIIDEFFSFVKYVI